MENVRKYIVLEIQIDAQNQFASIINNFDDFAQAESSFHLICASACVSQVAKHTVIFMDDNGMEYERKAYVHETQE